MATKPRAIFVFPVFNEEPNVAQVLLDLDRIKQITADFASEVNFLFIDDGSSDKTVTLLKAPARGDLTVISHGVNKGPGAAFNTAFEQIFSENYSDDDLVITLEGDATSDPKMLLRMLMRTQEGDGIVLASPYLYGGGFSLVEGHRLMLSHIANFLYKLILNIRGLSTISCFFRIYRVGALKTIKRRFNESVVRCQGFECAAEIVLKATRCKISISEVPFQVDWGRRKGKSKMKIFKTVFGYLKMFARYYDHELKAEDSAYSFSSEKGS